MGTNEILNKYKHFVIFIAIGGSILYLFDFLPVSLFELTEENTKYAYTAVLVLAAYSYFTFHYRQVGPEITRKLPARDISDPKHQAYVAGQFGDYAQYPERSMPAAPPTQRQTIEEETFEKFRKE